ncbi:MAG: leucine-rich repeat protein [Clostridiales bacterium]|nr:leucine-rich repeat protein [Clostridiales bacterium]
MVAEEEEDRNTVDLCTQTVEIALSYETVLYDGEAKEPDVTVSCAGITLTEGTDFTVSYENNIDIGTQATVIITGIGGYEGSVTATFSIVETYGGVCGDDLTWTLSADGLLTISGTGDMYDFEFITYGYVDGVWTYAVMVPWYNVRESITSVIIQNGVTGIGDYAFYECDYMTDVSISDSVTSIGREAFSNCGSLTDISIPQSVTEMDACVFWGCVGLTEIRLPDGLTKIPGGTFAHCSDLATVTIPEGVTEIGYDAFWGCTSLTDIVLPEGLTTIGMEAFSGCDSLTEITIPDSVTSMGENAFAGCDLLSSVMIGSGLTRLEDRVFDQCASLLDITVPANIVYVGEAAFGECEEIVFEGSAPTFSDYAFYETTATAYYPLGDSSWNDVVGNDYGGTITWVAYVSVPAEEDEPDTETESTETEAPETEAAETDPTETGAQTESETGGNDGLQLDADGVFRYYDDGKADTTFNGIAEYDGASFFVANGVLCSEANGLNLFDGVWYFLSGGQIQTQHTGFALYDGEWFYITNGILDTSKNGLESYDGELFLFAEGHLLDDYSGLWLNAESIGGDNQWYFIAYGMVQNVSDVVMYDGAWFVVKNGILDTDYNGTIEYDGATFTVVSGQLY